MTKRVILIVLDSVGVGHARDADKFFNGDVPDTGANTLGHIVEECSPKLANLERLGIFHALDLAAGKQKETPPKTLVTTLHERSAGKDSTTGHFEICGLELEKDWGYFPHTIPAFPQDLMKQWIDDCNLTGVLGQRHDSGTRIMREFGEEHIKTSRPIVYTSADSVFQILAHEEHFGLERLNEICLSARKLMDPLNIGRIISRPFVGETPKTFERTGNRRDFSMPPPGRTLLDACIAENIDVHCVGKVADLFAGRSVTSSTKADGLPELFESTNAALNKHEAPCLIFTNFVDFDTEYGHRRDVKGYAEALEYFDSRLPEILEQLKPDDLLFITADHGNDPTWVGSDHTREQIPLLVTGQKIKPQLLPLRDSFADIGQSIAIYFGIEPLDYGTSFL